MKGLLSLRELMILKVFDRAAGVQYQFSRSVMHGTSAGGLELPPGGEFAIFTQSREAT